MKIKRLGKVAGHQDGAINNGYLFHCDSNGKCYVYRTDSLNEEGIPVCQFLFDNADIIVPHSNSVSFGNERYDETDEFPLLYCNIYNNYASKENKMLGVTCVYRITRKGNNFDSQLVQLIEINFTDDLIWKSENKNDVRPYGNIAIDVKDSMYYAFTMRDEDKTTRFFAFELPKLCDGIFDEEYKVKRVTLTKEDIKDYFDSEYHNFMQGACFYNGIIYAVEGFTNRQDVPPVLRLIDVKEKKQKAVYRFGDFGLNIEPELIDFEDDICYYADDYGNLYNLIF